MNAYDDNPFFVFVDNAPTFSVEVYPDMGKIVELSDTGCDARTPSASIGRNNNQKRPYSAKTLHSDVSSFRDVFDGREDFENEQYNEILDKRGKRVPARDRTVPRTPRNLRTMERDNNEKVDQWERNIADLKSTMLRGPANLFDDSSMENILDSDPISENSRTQFNSKNSAPRREINRKSRKEEMNMNVKNEIRGRIPDIEKNSYESRSTLGREEANRGKQIPSVTRPSRIDRREQGENFRRKNNEQRNEESNHFNGERRRSIDRAVDKDSLSDTSEMLNDLERSTRDNRESVVTEKNLSLERRSKVIPNETVKSRESSRRKENPSLERRSKTLFNQNVEVDKDDSRERKNSHARNSSREAKNRVTSQTRSISKSADFDKAKHRANMAKRYANKAWMKKNTLTGAKTENNEVSNEPKKNKADYGQKNEVTRAKAISKSAGSSTRKTEGLESREADITSSFDDKADTPKRATRNHEERSSTNRTRTTGVSVSRSFRRETPNNSHTSETRSMSQGGIQRRDLEKLSAIFLSSTLKRAGKSSFTRNKFNRNRNEQNTSDSAEKERIEETRTDRISSCSKIRPSISNLSKLPSKTEKWVKSKIPVAISRLKKELEEIPDSDNLDFGEFSSREPSSRSRPKSMTREKELVPNDEGIDESTSTGIISTDKSDCSKYKSSEKDEIRSRFDEWCKKLEETRRRERDVELKVLKMAKAQKDEMKKEFEKRGLREQIKKSKGESRNIVDIAGTNGTVFDKESIGKRSRLASNYNDTRDVIDGNYLEKDYANQKESQPKPSLRSTMYARYFPASL